MLTQQPRRSGFGVALTLHSEQTHVPRVQFLSTVHVLYFILRTAPLSL